ncbi:MAG: hypothetical protein KW788_04240 [Candidatus Doudnabacteria bacterium]|nr:hypothetical protein [Candidatus Doudnabacteria bacterium]
MENKTTDEVDFLKEVNVDDPITDDPRINEVISDVLNIWKKVYEISLVAFQDSSVPDGPLPRDLLEQFKKDYITAIEHLKRRSRETGGEYPMQELEKELPGNLWVPWCRERLLDEVMEHEVQQVQKEQNKKPGRDLN